jgi:hypothetical protein
VFPAVFTNFLKPHTKFFPELGAARSSLSNGTLYINSVPSSSLSPFPVTPVARLSNLNQYLPSPGPAQSVTSSNPIPSPNRQSQPLTPTQTTDVFKRVDKCEKKANSEDEDERDFSFSEAEESDEEELEYKKLKPRGKKRKHTKFSKSWSIDSRSNSSLNSKSSSNLLPGSIQPYYDGMGGLEIAFEPWFKKTDSHLHVIFEKPRHYVFYNFALKPPSDLVVRVNRGLPSSERKNFEKEEGVSFLDTELSQKQACLLLLLFFLQPHHERDPSHGEQPGKM